MLWGCILASGVGKFLQADATQTMMMMNTEKYSQISTDHACKSSDWQWLTFLA